jgi:IS1 family transposase
LAEKFSSLTRKIGYNRWLKWMKCTHNIGSKNFCRIWTATDRCGKRFISFVIADRSSAAAEEFQETIKRHEMEHIAIDYRKPYNYSERKAYSNKSGTLYR